MRAAARLSRQSALRHSPAPSLHARRERFRARRLSAHLSACARGRGRVRPARADQRSSSGRTLTPATLEASQGYSQRSAQVRPRQHHPQKKWNG
ncbi:hypothetical protein NDU88_000188 [Pleurodeles waltl]|uniref:Uncharacterized protein n=1 Tax=Pleurodeles waltl TaxID=8319 RepID=A0AAV7L7C8_PLEWA|nr:hypothetical protein NDU88_000188 [Pleurodeles waltl]